MKKRLAVIGLYGMSAHFAMDELPKEGETVHSTDLLFEGGGKGYNQAVSAMRMGADVFFATAVGTDSYGAQVYEDMAGTGFAEWECIPVPDTTTAYAAIAKDRNGNNFVMVNQGASLRITKEQIQIIRKRVEACDIVLTQLEMPLDVVEEVLAMGKRGNAFTILNTAPAKHLTKELLEKVDLITPNWGEALALAGLPGDAEVSCEEVSRILVGMGCKSVIITLGAKGAYVYEGGKGYLQKPFIVTSKDTTGAGDTFNGALAAGLLQGRTLRDSVQIAAAASAISVTRRAAVASIPQEEEVKEFMKASLSG